MYAMRANLGMDGKRESIESFMLKQFNLKGGLYETNKVYSLQIFIYIGRTTKLDRQS